jgi:hypothetical protein
MRAQKKNVWEQPACTHSRPGGGVEDIQTGYAGWEFLGGSIGSQVGQAESPFISITTKLTPR